MILLAYLRYKRLTCKTNLIISVRMRSIILSRESGVFVEADMVLMRHKVL